MDRSISFTTFAEEERSNPALEYWLTRTPDERIAEVERLRREYLEGIRGEQVDECAPGLRGHMLFVEREEG